MKYAKKIAKVVLLILGGRVLTSYLDPGSGSLIVQILIAIIVGILATFRLWKARLMSLFGIRRQNENEDDGELKED